MESQPHKLEHLVALAAILSRQTDFDEVLRVITQKAAFLLKAEAALIMMINPQTRHTVRTIFKEGESESERKYQALHPRAGHLARSIKHRFDLAPQRITPAFFSEGSWTASAIQRRMAYH